MDCISIGLVGPREDEFLLFSSALRMFPVTIVSFGGDTSTFLSEPIIGRSVKPALRSLVFISPLSLVCSVCPIRTISGLELIQQPEDMFSLFMQPVLLDDVQSTSSIKVDYGNVVTVPSSLITRISENVNNS